MKWVKSTVVKNAEVQNDIWNEPDNKSTHVDLSVFIGKI